MVKFLILLIIVSIVIFTCEANGELFITVDGVIDPPDSGIMLEPSDEATIGIWSGTESWVPSHQEFYLQIEGPGSLDISASTVYGDPGVEYEKVLDLGDGLYYVDLCIVIPEDPSIPQGMMVADFIELHCEGLGDVTLLFGNTPGGSEFDTQVIHQIPEPMTIVLLGLGGLFLRRRR